MSMTKCGFCGIYPKCLQNWASTRGFIAVYAVLGTVQAMAFIYVVVCLTTLEKRFKIPTQTIGIILSGNEISQILSIVLIYYGGSGHRPRWISVGVALSSLSCFVLALPHAIYGPGQDALSLTMEYLNASLVAGSSSDSSNNNNNNNKDSLVCSIPSKDKDFSRHEQCDQTNLDDTSIVPRLIVFFSQFILGIGTTLYYVLGQPYIDDNTKKKNTPMLLGITFAFRTIGPALGFVLGYLCLNLYVDPSLHPVIEKTDPRWLGAWWLGWIVLGTALALLAVLLAMFPQELRKSKSSNDAAAQAVNEMEIPLQARTSPLTNGSTNEQQEKPTIKDFLISTKRILSNEMLMFNMFSVVFYVLSTLPFMNFIAKYLEIQFQMSPGGGTIITGPLTLFGMVLGFLISGAIIGKYKPAPRTLLFWNVMVGLCFFFGQIWIMFLTCDSGGIEGIDFDSMQVNLTAPCNAACNCGNVKFSPVCHEASKTTFFSACHAGCRAVVNETTFSDCSCVTHLLRPAGSLTENYWLANDHVTAGPCKHDCFSPYLLFSVVTMLMNIFGCSGRIGNVLINYRCVEMRDKSLALGFSLLVVSLFALIPGPIVFGAIMDSTCMVWDISCKSRGNCWVYHRDDFRYYVNVAAAALCLVGVFFDMRVCFLSKGIDLYGDEEEEAVEAADEPNDQPRRLSS